MSATEKESSDRAHAGALHVRAFRRRSTRCASASPRPAPGRRPRASPPSPGARRTWSPSRPALADLTVVPHPEAAEDVSSSDALHAVLFDSGRPVLIAPQARAADDRHAHLPRLERHRRVGLRGVGARCPGCSAPRRCASCRPTSYQRRGPAAPDLAAYLALHGVHADIAMFHPVEREVGAGLLAAAREFGCDLLAMGAYSHSPAAPAHPRRRHAARAGARQAAGHDEPLSDVRASRDPAVAGGGARPM